MARQTNLAVENNFINGLVTEKSGMNFPENAVTDCMNVVFNKDGRITRRGGIQPEADFVSEGRQVSSGVNRGFPWFISTEDGPKTFFVFQRGTIVYFYDQSFNSLSQGKKDFVIPLTAWQTAGDLTDLQNERTAFSSGNNFLFVANKYIDPLYVEYNNNTDNITVNRITLKVRDFDGMDDGLDVDERPTTLSTAHKYNLFNQGWPIDRKVRVSRGDDKDLSNPKGKDAYAIDYFYNATGTYPSNGEIWWQYKNSFDLFSDTWFNRFGVGRKLVARGSNILEAFDQERYLGGTLISSTSSEGLRCPAVAFYAGRVWYAGPTIGGFSNNLYFSRQIRDEKDFGQCFQDNDPTSEIVPDLLPTDGGVVKILDIGEVLYLHAFQQALFVFATNGVWVISGADFGGFTADSYQVKKLSSIPTLTSWSFVDVDGIPMWWNLDGIYTIEGDGQNYMVKNISNEKIQTFYENIPGKSKSYAQGTYNRQENIVEWGYRQSAVVNDPEDYWQYDRILKLDLNIGAWYPWSMPTNYYFLLPLTVSGKTLQSQTVNVVDSTGAQVVDSIGRNVVTDLDIFQDDPSITKYFTYTDQATTARAEIVQTPGVTNSGGFDTRGRMDHINELMIFMNGDNVYVYDTSYDAAGPNLTTPAIDLPTVIGLGASAANWNIAVCQGLDYFLAWPDYGTGWWDPDTFYKIDKFDGTLQGSITFSSSTGTVLEFETHYSPNTGTTWFILQSGSQMSVASLDANGIDTQYVITDGGATDMGGYNPSIIMGNNDVLYLFHSPSIGTASRYITSIQLGTTGGVVTQQIYDIGTTLQAHQNRDFWFWDYQDGNGRICLYDGTDGIIHIFDENPAVLTLLEDRDMNAAYGWADNNTVSSYLGGNMNLDGDYMVFSDDNNILYRYNLRTDEMIDEVDMSVYSAGDPDGYWYDPYNEMVVILDSTVYNYFVYFYIPSAIGTLTFSEVDSTLQTDWDSEENPAWFETGYRIRGSLMMEAQTNYVTFVSKTDANNSFLVSGKWDWSTNDLGTKKKTTKQEGYKHKANTEYSARRLKLRGQGKVVQIRVDSNGNAPFDIAGWVTIDSITDTP